jgi:hypothetical protein
MKEFFKDFGVGILAVLFAGAVIGGLQLLAAWASTLPIVAAIVFGVLALSGFIYYIGKFLRGK